MKIEDIYELIINMGISQDPRGQKEIEKLLKKEKESYEKLSSDEKEEYDIEKLKNPYSDTRILNGDGGVEVEGVLAGIDISVGEVLLADRLREKGKKIDLIISHHPQGKALAALHDVLILQADIWAKFGMPINIGEGILQERIKEVHRTIMPVNHNQSVDAAKILNLPFICVHTPTDNIVTSYLQKMCEKEMPDTVKDLIKLLKEIPEYKTALSLNYGPTLIVGDNKNRVGKIMVDMTGGTSGPKEMIEKLINAGVGTLVCMHIKEDVRKEARKHHMNIVIAGHISSDSLGLNLLLDELEKDGIEITTCSGVIRVKR